MEPKVYFRKTFVFVFTFVIVYKFVGLIINRFADFDLTYLLKSLTAGFLTALILAGINYFAKVDFFTKKGDRKPKDQ